MPTQGQRIKKVREALGMTQAAFADAIGAKTTHTRVSEWEKDKVKPETGTLGLMARAARHAFDPEEVFAWLVDGGEMPQRIVYASKPGIPGLVAEPEDIAHTAETAVRLKLYAEAVGEILAAGGGLTTGLAIKMVHLVTDGWARAETMRSAAGTRGLVRQQSG